jgi:drug/metabolite transporter (DMT)-like permease
LNPLPISPAPLWAVAALLVNATAWGLSWWPMRYFESVGLHSLWTTAAMFGLASLTIAAVRPGSIQGVLSNPWMWALALVSGGTNTAFNWGVTVGEVIRVVLLFYLMPVWAAGLARLLLAEPLTPAALGRIGLALTGAAVVLWEPGVGAPFPVSLGDWLGLAGGAGFALVNVILRRKATVPATDRALAMAVGGVIVPLALIALLSGLGRLEGPPQWESSWTLPLLAFAAVMLVANLMLQFGAARLPSRITSIVLLIEVPVAAASAALLAGERLSAQVLVGGALILLASLLAARGK